MADHVNLTITADFDGRVFMLAFQRNEVMSNIKELVAAEFNLPAARLSLVYNGAVVSDQATLAQAGIKSDDILVVTRNRAAAQVRPGLPCYLTICSRMQLLALLRRRSSLGLTKQGLLLRK
jgi:hypothetical protein